MRFTVEGQVIEGTELFRRVFEGGMVQRYHPNFVKFYGGLTRPGPLAAHVRHVRSLFRLAGCDMTGKTVLDAGCGYGVSAILLALLGARESHGVDCQARAMDTFQRVLEALLLPLPVYPALADAARLPYPDGYFDVVLAVEAISHFRRVDDFLAEAARVLRRPEQRPELVEGPVEGRRPEHSHGDGSSSGGVLIISDANNGANWLRAYRTRRIWNAFENGPPTENCYGHRIGRSFVQRRRAIIAEAFPHLSEEELDFLSRGTSGLWKPQILAAVEHYVKTGERPQHFYRWGTCPLDPTIGHYAEALFQPLELRRHIEGFGFQAEVFSHFGGARGGIVEKLNRILSWQPLTVLSIRVARGFVIVARRV